MNVETKGKEGKPRNHQKPESRGESFGVFRAALILFFLLFLPAGALTKGPSTPAVESASPGSPSIARPDIGFATSQKLHDHYQKHGREFGKITQEEYLRRAQELRDQPAGGDILQVVRKDGVITRFDRKSGAFLAYNPDATIRTFFKPNDGENYFWRQTRRNPKR